MKPNVLQSAPGVESCMQNELLCFAMFPIFLAILPDHRTYVTQNVSLSLIQFCRIKVTIVPVCNIDIPVY